MQDMTNSTNWSSSTCLFLLLLAYQKQCPSPTPLLTYLKKGTDQKIFEISKILCKGY